MLRNRRPIRTFDILEDRTVPATYQWTGTGANANWNNAANWTLISGTGTFPNAVGDIAQFTGAYTADQKAVITTAVTVGEIDFGGSGYTGNFGVTISKTAGGLTLANTSGPAILNVLPSANTTAQTITFNSLASGLVATGGGLIVNQNAGKLNLTITIPIKTGSFGEYATVSAGTLLQNDNANVTTIGPSSTFTVNGGTLAIGSTTALGVGQNNLGLGTITLNGGTLKINNAANPVPLANNIVFGPDASVTLTGAPFLFLGGTITLNGNNTLKVNTGTLTNGLLPATTTIADSVTGGDAAGSTLTVSTASTGILSLGDVTFAGSNPITLAGKALTLASGTSYAGGVSTTPTFTANAPTTIASALTSALTGTVASLVVAGSNTLTLSGANTYAGGTTVSTGTLRLAGGSTSSVQIDPGATLSGSGSVAGLTLGSGNLHLNLTSAAGYDQVSVDGTVDLTGATLSLNVGDVGDNDTFTILSVAGSDPASVVGTFNGLPTSGSTFLVGTRSFRIDYAGGDGNDVVLTAVPALTVATLVGDPALNAGNSYVSHGNQHSIVDRVVYSFSQAVNLNASDFTISNLGASSIGGSSFAAYVPELVVTPNADDTVWTVTFANHAGSSDGVNDATGSIGDGKYRLTLAAANGLANTFDFYRLLGDVNGTGTLDGANFQAFITAFNQEPGSDLYLGADDFDGGPSNPSVNGADFQTLVTNFNHTVGDIAGFH